MKIKKRLPWIEVVLVLAAIAYAAEWWRASKWQGPVEEKYISHTGG